MDDKLVPIPVRDMMCRHIGGKAPTAEMKAKLARIKLSEDNFTGEGLSAYKTLVRYATASLTFFIANTCFSVHSYDPSWTSAQKATRLGAGLWQGTPVIQAGAIAVTAE